ncbi:MAG: DUF4301 family protein [Syntrophales bacterium]
MPYYFSAADIEYIDTQGVSVNQVETQIRIFEKGTFFYRLNRPCTINDGIMVVPGSEREELIRIYDREADKGRMLKFVPASGAASRMFQEWSRYHNRGNCDEHAGFKDRFLKSLPQYAFYPDLEETMHRKRVDLDEFIKRGKCAEILEFILTPRGLNYSNLPKALLKFHKYPDGNRTPLEEHLVEAALCVRDARGICRLHITVSQEHKRLLKQYLKRIVRHYEEKYGVLFDIQISVQALSTNTIAVDMENVPFRNHKGRFVFRPGGHGALLENLNSIDGDIIQIKNIDNVAPDPLKIPAIVFKKILGGILIRLQDAIFDRLRRLSSGKADSREMDEIVRFCRQDLNVMFPAGFHDASEEAKKTLIIQKLNRPLRVCGMVKNEGEPGGGPFWVDEPDGTQSMQIVEEAQVNLESERQKEIWMSATHFNPVDLVCGVRNDRGEKFNLQNYVDRRAFFITKKSVDGREIKALEYPGLWNGSMADWNTVFVEIPIDTFNPVKTVEDLLRKQHQG